ncbi:hypothetical protein H0H92_014317, partial [Tricholoma furcatifolium]
FYLGILPDIKSILLEARIPDLSPTLFGRLHIRLAHAWHTASIHLAARIWGAALRSRHRSPSSLSSRPPRPVISLPPNLANLIPLLSDSSFVTLL